MKEIPIRRALSEDTRLQSIWIKPEADVFSLHYRDDCYYITDHSDETKIYRRNSKNTPTSISGR